MPIWQKPLLHTGDILFELMTFEGSVRVMPEDIGSEREESVRKSLGKTYENNILADTECVVLAVTRAWDVEGGAIEVEDPGIHYDAKFEALVFVPKLHEVVVGHVVDITDFGVFIRFGPIDGLCHVSQVVNDYVSHDKKSETLITKQGNKTLKVGDTVRARVTGVSLEKKEVNKITLTMRQPGLGNVEWLKAEKEEKKKPAKNTTKKAEGKKAK